jgi:Fic family protein
MSTSARAYERTHPWISFRLELREDDIAFWALLGEARSKIEHLRGVFLKPSSARRLHELFLAKGVHATTAIEGNTLSEEEALQVVEGRKLELPPSREYLAVELENIVTAWNAIESAHLAGHLVPLTSELINTYNGMVLDGLQLDEEVVPGKVRKHSVAVGRYRGAPAEDCEYLLRRLCEWLDSESFSPPDEQWIWPFAIIRAAIAHLYLAWIHPYGDGNGRTARLVELHILVSAGIPTPATHLLSNHYNKTRTEYYRQLEYASESGGDAFELVKYAAAGFVDGLREQLEIILRQQFDDRWEQFVYESFGEARTQAALRQRQLVLDLSKQEEPVPKRQLQLLSPEIAQAYASKTMKTLTRDVNVLVEKGLIELVPYKGYIAKKSRILVFLPPSTDGRPLLARAGPTVANTTA